MVWIFPGLITMFGILLLVLLYLNKKCFRAILVKSCAENLFTPICRELSLKQFTHFSPGKFCWNKSATWKVLVFSVPRVKKGKQLHKMLTVSLTVKYLFPFLMTPLNRRKRTPKEKTTVKYLMSVLPLTSYRQSYVIHCNSVWRANELLL